MADEKNPNEVYARGETELLLIHRNDFKAALDRFPGLYDMAAVPMRPKDAGWNPRASRKWSRTTGYRVTCTREM